MTTAKGRRLALFVLLLLIVAGIVLRWLFAERISLYFDEFTTLWAARTILRRGIPLFPSGNFYSHGLLFTYLEAPFLWAFGLERVLLRLPSLLISVGAIIAAFAIGKRLFSAPAGLVAAAAMAVDPEAVAWGGRVRMYGLLQLLVLLATYAFYRGAIEQDRPTYRWLAAGLLVAAIFTHAEAALLVPALALAVLIGRGLRWCLRPSIMGPFLLAAAAFAAVVFGLDVGQASLLEAVHESRPMVALPTSDLFSGLKGFAPALLDWWRLPFTLLAIAGLISAPRWWGRRSPRLMLYLVLVVILGELFFLAGPTWQTPRYAFILLPFLWLAAAATFGDWLKSRPVGWSAAAALAVAVFVGIVGWRATFVQDWGYDLALEYLQRERQPGDVVLSANCAASALYLGQCDYYAMQFGYEEYTMPGPDGKPIDRYVGAPVLDSVAQLRRVLATAPRVWLLVDGWRFQSRFSNEFIRTVLDQMEPIFDRQGMAVFRGQGYAERPAPSVRRQVVATVGHELALEGYEISASELQPGAQLEVSLFWRALEAPRTAYTVFLHLIGPDGQRVAQRDELLLGGFYQPTVWPREEMVTDRHLLELPAGLPPGRYRLEAGLYLPDDPGTILSTEESGERITLCYLQVPGLTAPEPQNVLTADFGEQIRLLGYTLDCDAQASTCTVQLHWQALAGLDSDYTVFVHLAGEEGLMAGQHDGMPEGGFYPTSAWQPGEVVVDEHRLEVAAATPPGNFQLRVGFYRLETGERLPVLDASGRPVGDYLVLTAIQIPLR